MTGRELQGPMALPATAALVLAGLSLFAGASPAVAQPATPPAITTGLSAAAQPVFTQSVALAQATSVINAAPGDSREVRRIRELEGLLTTAVNERDAARSGGAAALAAAEARLTAARATYAAEADRLFNELRLARDELDRYKADLSLVLVIATPEELDIRQRVADGDFSRFDRMQELRRTRQAAQRQRDADAAAAQAQARAREQAAEVRTEAQTYSASVARATPGDTSAALLAIWDEAAELDGSDFFTHIERSRLAVTIGDLPRALAAARQASAAATTDRERYVALHDQGVIALAQGSLPLATRAQEESLAIARRLALADPSSAAAARDLSIGLVKVGDVAVARGDLAAARSLYEESLAILRRLVLADPSSAAAARDLAVGLIIIGDVAVARGDLAAARSVYEESLAIQRRLALADPSSAQAARDLSFGLERVGDVAVASGDLTAARTAYEESLAIARRLALADPSSAAAGRSMSVGLIKVGDVAVARGDLAAARSVYEESLAIQRRLALADPSSAQAARDLSVGLEKVGDVARARGDLAAARSLYEESLAIRRRLALADPSSAAAASYLSFGLVNVGDVARARGDLAAARSLYEESLAIRRRLALADPSSAVAARGVGVSLDRLARIPGSGVRWADVAAHWRDMQARGMLASDDQPFLADYERRAAREVAAANAQNVTQARVSPFTLGSDPVIGATVAPSAFWRVGAGEDFERGTVHQVEVTAGTRLLITVTSAAMDPVVRAVMLGPDGALVLNQADDDGGGGTNARLAITAPATGMLYLIVSDYQDRAGAYAIQVTPEP